MSAPQFVYGTQTRSLVWVGAWCSYSSVELQVDNWPHRRFEVAVGGVTSNSIPGTQFRTNAHCLSDVTVLGRLSYSFMPQTDKSAQIVLDETPHGRTAKRSPGQVVHAWQVLSDVGVCSPARKKPLVGHCDMKGEQTRSLLVVPGSNSYSDSRQVVNEEHWRKKWRVNSPETHQQHTIEIKTYSSI